MKLTFTFSFDERETLSNFCIVFLYPCSDEPAEKKVKLDPTPNGAPEPPPSSVPPPPEPAPAYPSYAAWGSYPVRIRQSCFYTSEKMSVI